MSRRRIAVIVLSGVLIAGGATAAIAAVATDDAGKAEQALLDDAAKRLDVTPDKLREALSQARDAQLDQAVEDGDLTRKQADAIKAAREQSGRVLGGPPGPRGKHGGPRPGGGAFGPGGPGFGLHRELKAELAKALGTTPAKLREQLRAGMSIADIAKANGKTLAGVRSAVKAAAKTRADKAVADGDLTRKQADALLERLDQRLEKLDAVHAFGPRGHRHRHRRGAKPPAGAIRPGSLTPDENPVELASPGTRS